MSNIKDFFSPTGSVKRNRANTSPEQLMSVRKYTKTSDTLVMSEKSGVSIKDIERLLDNKLAVLATKADTDRIIEELNSLREENRVLKNEVSELKKQNREIQCKLNDLENRSRRNNVIIKGLKREENSNITELVKKFCVEMLGTRADIWINRAHPLGKNRKNGPVIAHIPDDYDIKCIFKNVRNLKGTEYIVHRDFSETTRRVRAKLFEIKKEIKKVLPAKEVVIVQDKLLVEGKTFTMECGKLRTTVSEDGLRELSEFLGHDFAYLDNFISNRNMQGGDK